MIKKKRLCLLPLIGFVVFVAKGMRRLLLLILSVIPIYGYQGRQAIDEPFCSTEAVLQAKFENDADNSTEGRPSWTTQLLLSLNDTACFVTNAGPMRQNRHVIKFLRVEHHYGVKGTYEFGIPLMKQSCLCDCEDSEEICKVDDYQYRNCSTGPVCYRTLQPYQSSAGCISSGASSLCCEIRLEPYERWRFQAVQLKQPNTVYIVEYKIFTKRGRHIKITYNKVFNFTMNKGVTSASIELEDDEMIGLELQSNRPHRQLEPGMYFWQKDQLHSEVRGNVRLNEPSENSLEKLGWFRYEKDSWTVRRGLEKITKAQHIQVENCKAQRYMSSFDAEQFVLQLGEEKRINYDLGSAIKDVEPWVSDIRIHDRVLEVIHSEGNALGIYIKTTVQPDIFRHNSQLGDFSGTIHMDSLSNCYMNLTFKDVRGPLQGEVYSDGSRNFAELFFHIQAGDQLEPIYRSVVSLPASVDSRREVCIHPYGDPLGRECRWLEFISQPLQQPQVRSLWTMDQSECDGCNERGLEGFIVNLNPARWFNGLNSKMEITAFAFETGVMIGVALLLIILFLKCIVPLCCCLKWTFKPVTYRGDKKRKLDLEKF